MNPKPGEIFDIPNLGKRVVVDAFYAYDDAPTLCPVCDKCGIPWHGYFSCQTCEAVALVEDGIVFMPIGSNIYPKRTIWDRILGNVPRPAPPYIAAHI